MNTEDYNTLKDWVEKKAQSYELEITPNLAIYHRLLIMGKLELCKDFLLQLTKLHNKKKKENDSNYTFRSKDVVIEALETLIDNHRVNIKIYAYHTPSGIKVLKENDAPYNPYSLNNLDRTIAVRSCLQSEALKEIENQLIFIERLSKEKARKENE